MAPRGVGRPEARARSRRSTSSPPSAPRTTPFRPSSSATTATGDPARSTPRSPAGRPYADIRRVFADREDVTIDELDGLTIATPDRCFNLRPSNTQPLLRLNMEARDELTMIAVRDEILDPVRDG